MNYIRILSFSFLSVFIFSSTTACTSEVQASNDIENECRIFTPSHNFSKVNESTIYYNQNDYSLNFITNKGKTVSTNSYTTVC